MSIGTDEMFMRRCLQLARCGRQGARPNPMVGAVLVSADGRIIGEGYHVRCGEAHAEVNAFASVKAQDEHLLPEATLYVSLEPCSHYGRTPPCADLIVAKGVKRVVVGCQDDFAKVHGRGIRRLREAGITVTVGVLEKECRWLNRRFFTFHREHRPYIILKWAQTANGFIDHDGRPLAISSPFTQMLCHKLRSEADAIAVGRVTDEREHPRLDVRHWAPVQGDLQSPSPRRIVISHQHPIDLNLLYDEQVQTLLVEGGAMTLRSFIHNGLWDEIRIETNLALTVPKGTPAPALPQGLSHADSDAYGPNIITNYYNDRLDAAKHLRG